MSSEKIKAVSKYLNGSDDIMKAKALKKLEAYLDRGYDRELIELKLKSFVEREENQKLRRFARSLIRDQDLTMGKPKKMSSFQRTLAMSMGFFIFVMVVLIILPTKSQKSEDFPEKVLNELESVQPVKKETGRDEWRANTTPQINLDTARTIPLNPKNDFGELLPVDGQVTLRFIPGNMKLFTTRNKVIQRLSSKGVTMTEKELSFILRKRVLKRQNNSITLGMTLTNSLGNANPVLLGFPKKGKEILVNVGENFSVTNNGSSHLNYDFPFPIFSEQEVKTGSTWGVNSKNGDFAIHSQYKLNGQLNYRNKELYQVSFLSVAERRSEQQLYHVDRKGVFYIDKRTGHPMYLKLHSVTKTSLKGTGFPIESESIIEESLL